MSGPAMTRPRGRRRLALAVLLAAAALAVAAFPFRARWWGGLLLAIAEAGVVGGLADWFAVTAIFRHPLGVPIPHTAIIPANKYRIGRSLGQFVQQNFLSPELVAVRLREAQPARRAGAWLAEPANAHRASETVATVVAGLP